MTSVARRVRHAVPPQPNSCRWCGIPEREHGQRWTPSKSWHAWEAPTAAQRRARMLTRRMLRIKGS